MDDGSDYFDLVCQLFVLIVISWWLLFFLLLYLYYYWWWWWWSWSWWWSWFSWSWSWSSSWWWWWWWWWQFFVWIFVCSRNNAIRWRRSRLTTKDIVELCSDLKVPATFPTRPTARRCGSFNMVNTYYILTMWGPPVISWFISPSNYSYKYHKP